MENARIAELIEFASFVKETMKLAKKEKDATAVADPQERKEIKMKIQFGESKNADLKSGLWTFEMQSKKFKASSGKYAIIDESVMKELFKVISDHLRYLKGAHLQQLAINYEKQIVDVLKNAGFSTVVGFSAIDDDQTIFD